MKVTIKDVAQSAGVSISTVSRVLNQSGPVTPETRKRVLEAVRKHQYVPNANAQNLKITQSKNIAILVSNMNNPFFTPMIRVIERRVALRGYHLVIEIVDGDLNEVRVARRKIVEDKLCGVIFIGGTYEYTTEDFLEMGDIPRVLLTFTAEKNVPKNLYSSVQIDDAAEAYKATEHLIQLGHEQIAFFTKSPMETNTTGHKRLIGYQNALAAYGLAYNPSIVIDCEYSPSSGASAMRRVLAESGATAVFAAADIIAIGAAKAVLAAGRSIPADISIIGFDGIEIAEYYHPALDTISQPGPDMAAACVDILFEMITADGKNQHRVFDGTLLKRGSCERRKNYDS